MSYQLKLWDSKRERINRPEHTAGRSQNKGSEQVQRRAHRLQNGPAPPEAGGRGEGKRAGSGPKDRIPYHTANRPPISHQRLPESLDGRHPPRGSRRDRAYAPDRRGRELGLGLQRGWDCRGEKVRCTRGDCARQASWLPEPLGRGRHKKQAQLFVPRFCGTPEGWNPAQRRARSIQSSQEPEQHRWGKQRQPLGKA